MKDADFNFIDLCCGVGGFTYVLNQLNGKCDFASDIDKKASETYLANFGELPFGDLADPENQKYIPTNADLLTAGFPCQAFSIVGQRKGFADEKGQVFLNIAQIIKDKQPKAFILENVKGLVTHDKKRTLNRILHILRNDLNYFVPDPQVLNAVDFGLAQKRERIFIVGFRKDLNITAFNYPMPTHKGKPVGIKTILEQEPVAEEFYMTKVANAGFERILKFMLEKYNSQYSAFIPSLIEPDQPAAT